MFFEMLSTCCCQLYICNKNRWNKKDTFLGNLKIELFAEKMLVMFMRKNLKLHFFEVNLGFIANHNSFMSKNYFLLIFSINIVLLSIVGNSLARLIPLNPRLFISIFRWYPGLIEQWSPALFFKHWNLWKYPTKQENVVNSEFSIHQKHNFPIIFPNIFIIFQLSWS